MLLVKRMFFPLIYLNIGNTSYLISNLGAKQPACTSWTNSPGVHILWIRPHKITEGPLVWNLLVAFDGADLVQSLDVRWKTTMDTQDLLIYQLGLEIKRCQNQAVWDKKDVFDMVCKLKSKK